MKAILERPRVEQPRGENEKFTFGDSTSPDDNECDIHVKRRDPVSKTHVMDVQDAFSRLTEILARQTHSHLAQVRQHGRVYLRQRLVLGVCNYCAWRNGGLGDKDMRKAGIS